MSGIGAKRGFSRETLFSELINNDNKFRANLEHSFYQLGIFDGEIISAEDVKSSCKSDVKIYVKDKFGYKGELGCSLKAAEANFNQIDRRWLSDWADVLDMPALVKDMIQSSLDRKITNSRAVFILPEQKSTVLPYLKSVNELIFKELFTREDENLKVFVTYDEVEKKWYVSKVDDIIQSLKQEQFTTTSKGVIKIGESLSLQRKGGDGNITNIPKSSPLHPSNQLQFKIKPLTIIKKVPTKEIKA